jgi:hypothetical protein
VNVTQREAMIQAEALHSVTYCRSNNCNLRDYLKSLADGGHWSQEHASLVALRLVHLGYDIDSAGERLPELQEDDTVLFYCAGPSCPGLPFKASEHPHPASCAWSDD